MRFFVGCFLLLVCSVGLAQESTSCNDSMTIIEQEAKLIQQDLRRALKRFDENSLKQKEAESIIENSQRTINKLQNTLDNSKQIIGDLKSFYQQRIAGLKDLVMQLEQRLTEQNELDGSFENIETESMKTVKAQAATIRWQRIGLIILGVVTTGVLTWSAINAVQK